MGGYPRRRAGYKDDSRRIVREIQERLGLQVAALPSNHSCRLQQR